MKGDERQIYVRQVPLLWSSLTKGNLFVLDSGDSIFQFQGRNANPWERYEGNQLSTKIRNERRGKKPSLYVIEESHLSTHANDEQVRRFCGILRGQTVPMSPMIGTCIRVTYYDLATYLVDVGCPGEMSVGADLLHHEMIAFQEHTKALLAAQRPSVQEVEAFELCLSMTVPIAGLGVHLDCSTGCLGNLCVGEAFRISDE